jgi:hypothetical protein
LAEFEEWRPLLHDIGSCEVKHAVQLGVVNLYSDDAGNPQLPKKFHALKQHRARVRWAEIAAAVLVIVAIAGGIALFSRNRTRPIPAIPEKSIAVLPFENLSSDKDTLPTASKTKF